MKAITIGRSKENNDIIIDDAKVSRYHLQIVQDDMGNYTIMDLDSTNGTYVNGQRIYGKAALRPGDEVRIGDTQLPWQSYFAQQQPMPGGNGEATPKPSQDDFPLQQPKKNGGRTVLFIIIAALATLLIAGAIVWIVKSNQEKQEGEKKDLEISITQAEVDAKEQEAIEAQRNYEEALKEAKRTGSQEKLRIADSLGRIAEKKNTEYNNLKKERDKLEKEKEALEKDKKNLNDQVTTLSSENKTQIDQIEKYKNRVDQLRKDSLALIEQKKLTQQTNDFYKAIGSIDKDRTLDDICNTMGWAKQKKDKKNYICNKFDDAKTSEERAKIIEVVKNAKKSQNNNTNNQKTKDDNTSTDKNEAKTTTGSKPAPESKTEMENTPTQNE